MTPDDPAARQRLVALCLDQAAANQRALLAATPTDPRAAWRLLTEDEAVRLWRERLSTLSLHMLAAQLDELQATAPGGAPATIQ